MFVEGKKTILLLLIGFSPFVLISRRDQFKENHEISINGSSKSNNVYDFFLTWIYKYMLGPTTPYLNNLSTYMVYIHIYMFTLGSKGVAFLLFFPEGSSSVSGSKV